MPVALKRVRNIELLKEVRRMVAADKRRKNKKLNMASWGELPVRALAKKFPIETNSRATQDLKLGIEDLPCGTTACIAGWTTLIHGDQWLAQDYGSWAPLMYLHEVVCTDTGKIKGVSERAEQLLGLTEDQADWLFSQLDEMALWALDLFITGKDFTSEELDDLAEAELRRLSLTGD